MISIFNQPHAIPALPGLFLHSGFQKRVNVLETVE
jgi:hypothetical protein